MTQPISITVLDNGPLKISCGAATVRYCGEPVQTGEGDVYVCRCGLSSKPPYCDGSHGREGFVAEPAASEAGDVKVWEGRNIRTTFNPSACMHVFYCKPLKELRQRELDGDDDAAAEIARVVASCPSGALGYEATAVAPLDTPDESIIDIIEGGEVRIRGPFEINAKQLTGQDGVRATLCRCGLSKNKPWCDGRHKGRREFR